MRTLKFRDINGDVQVVNENNDVSKKVEASESMLELLAYDNMQKDAEIEALKSMTEMLAFELIQSQGGM